MRRGLVCHGMDTDGGRAENRCVSQFADPSGRTENGSLHQTLIADLEIVKDLGKIKDVWTFTPEEVNALGGDEVNVRTRALYLSVDSHKVDVIVAASFDMESTNAGTKVTVIGYPARFVNWRTATDADNEWIRNEVMKPEDNRKATQAISQ